MPKNKDLIQCQKKVFPILSIVATMTEVETQNWRKKKATAYVLFLCHPLTFQSLNASLQQYI